jgi:transposase-like protein
MTMTDALIELIEKDADTDLVREMLSFAAERLMEAEVEARTGAGHGLRDPARQVQRNGYRGRAWDTRAGRIDLEIPRLRKGRSYEEANSGQRSARLFSPQITSGDRHVHTSLFSSAVRCSRRPRRYLRLDGAKSVEMVDHLTVAGKR